MTTIRTLPQLDDAEVEALTALLVEIVDGGASVGFLSPLAPRARTRVLAAGRA